MSSYFTIPSILHAKDDQEQLQASKSQSPVLSEEDEKFFNRQIEAGRSIRNVPISSPKEQSDSPGNRSKPQRQDAYEIVSNHGQVNQNNATGASAQEDTEPSSQESQPGSELQSSSYPNSKPSTRTWSSYLPTSLSSVKATRWTSNRDPPKPLDGGPSEDPNQQRTWSQYATSYVPTSIRLLPNQNQSRKQVEPEPVYNEDGSVNQEKTLEKQEREVSRLLGKMNLGALNSRVFALSAETQKIYERFAIVLRDTIDGVPTAYDDMEKFMRDTGPQLEKKFKAMPPFVQALVKVLPAKIGASLGPELLATKGESSEASSTAVPKPTHDANLKKQKRRIPSIKSLMRRQGALTAILRGAVEFIETRFPFLASATNVVLSLAIFILMFVLWYCHKRGKEVRLASESQGADQTDDDAGSTESEDMDQNVEQNVDERDAELEEKMLKEMEVTLNHPDPSQVPLPDA